MKNILTKTRGQALAEYSLILVLVGVFCLFAAKACQKIIISLFENFVFIYSIPTP